MRFLYAFFALMVTSGLIQVNAQEPSKNIVTVQPKIMVVPFTKEGEDIRTVLEGDDKKIIALTKIKEHFDMRGFTTVDFLGKYKAAKEGALMASGAQNDLKSAIIQSSGADIYVEAKVEVIYSSTGNAVSLVLTAHEVSTGNSIANKIGNSSKYYTDQIDRLTSKAVESCIEEFLNVMQDKFTQIVVNGRSIIVDITLSEDSKNNFDTEIKGLPFRDLLELWFEENAYKNNYHVQGTTSNRMIFDDVKIPLKDQQTGLNYNPNKFSLALYQYFRELGLEVVSRSVKSGSIFITLK